jgi:hypothetical protein
MWSKKDGFYTSFQAPVGLKLVAMKCDEKSSLGDKRFEISDLSLIKDIERIIMLEKVLLIVR